LICSEHGWDYSHDSIRPGAGCGSTEECCKANIFHYYAEGVFVLLIGLSVPGVRF